MSSGLKHLQGRADSIATALDRPRLRAWMLGLCLAGFAVALAVALHRDGAVLLTARLGPLSAVAAIVIPAGVLLNALEFRWMTGFVGTRIALGRSISVIVISSAANLMPLPGALAVRVAELKASGSSYRAGLTISLASSVLWLAVALLVGGGAGMWLGGETWPWLMMTAGSALFLGAAMALQQVGAGLRGLVVLSLFKLAMVGAGGARLFLCLRSIDVAITAWQSAVLAVSGAIGAAVSIVPAGLGIREGVVAGLAPAVGVPFSLGLIAATLNRILEIIALLLWSGLIAWRQQRRGNAVVAPEADR